jgi:hypothetical protein
MADFETTKPPACEVLLAYIRRRYGSIPAFCEANDLDRIKVQRAINGDIQRIDVEFAVAVEDATDGEVKPADWVPPGNVREARRQRRSAAARAARGFEPEQPANEDPPASEPRPNGEHPATGTDGKR